MEQAVQTFRAAPFKSLLALAVCAAAAVPVLAHAQAAWPAKPVRLIVPFTGGSSDVVARILAPKLTESLGQTFIVENKPGANTMLGTDLVAKAAPDGYTMLVVLTTHAIGASLIKTPYDPIKDFAPVAAVSVAELGMATHPSVPGNTLREFIAHARNVPQPVTYATTQLGGNQHLAGELLTLITGAKLSPVPYKGGGDALAAVLGGHVGFYFGAMPTLLPAIRSGKLKGLAVTGNARNPAYPEVPTFAEGGVPNFEIRLWYGVLAPAGTPADIVKRMSDLMIGYVAQPEFRATLAKQGMDPMPLNSAQFADFLKVEFNRYADIIKRANVKIDP
jgi:tripartite-type tricarboxylate transporter receptor subunit TctC